jgi:phosphoglycerol transferase MdoB-like AlkP superfamily enzyme
MKLKTFLNKLLNYIMHNKLFLAFTISSLINSTLLRFFTLKDFFYIKPFLGDLASLILIGSLGYFFRPKNRFKYYLTISIIFTTICVINSIYYTNFFDFASVSLLATSLQVIGVGDAVVENIMELKDFIFLWQILFVIIVNTRLRKAKNDYKAEVGISKVHALNGIVVSLIVFGFVISMLTPTDASRIVNQWNKASVTKEVGLYVYQVSDIIVTIKTKLSPLFGYDKAINNVREFYNLKDNTQEENEYTDIFKGKNIITIHAESIQNFAMDKSFNNLPVTPNLNKLASEGLYFSNYYSQTSIGTSSDTEFTVLSSMLPASSGTVAISYWNRTYDTTLKHLKNLGYATFSMHANKGTYWNRNVIHPIYGFDNFFYYNKDFTLDDMTNMGLSDKSFFSQAIPKIKEMSSQNKNFYANLIMLTNHTPFSDVGLTDYEVNFKYEAIDPETGETTTKVAPFLEDRKLGNYLKSTHYADEAIGEFINGLDEEGLLENTVIVIYGDHDAKIRKSEYVYYYNYDPYTESKLDSDDPDYKKMDAFDYELNRSVPLIIWTKDEQVKGEITEVMGMYDLAPTLANMFGFEMPYALGHDIFSDEKNIVVFPDSSWMTDIMYYNSPKNAGKVLDINETISPDYIKENSDYATKLVKISNDIIVYDLIKVLEKEKASLPQ